jgi:hypothetical protein
MNETGKHGTVGQSYICISRQHDTVEAPPTHGSYEPPLYKRIQYIYCLNALLLQYAAYICWKLGIVFLSAGIGGAAAAIQLTFSCAPPPPPPRVEQLICCPSPREQRASLCCTNGGGTGGYQNNSFLDFLA